MSEIAPKCDNCGKHDSEQAVLPYLNENWCLDCKRQSNICVTCDTDLATVYEDCYELEIDQCPTCMKYHHGKAIYKGEEFPEFIGKECEVFDDYTNPKNPCYFIVFEGGEEYGGIGDEEIEFL